MVLQFRGGCRFSQTFSTLALAPGVSLAEVKLQKTKCEKPKTVKVDSQFSDLAASSIFPYESGYIFGPVNAQKLVTFRRPNNAPDLGPPKKTQGLEDLGVFEDVQFRPQTISWFIESFLNRFRIWPCFTWGASSSPSCLPTHNRHLGFSGLMSEPEGANMGRRTWNNLHFTIPMPSF
jgi:hypothetical protein